MNNSRLFSIKRNPTPGASLLQGSQLLLMLKNGFVDFSCKILVPQNVSLQTAHGKQVKYQVGAMQ